jgi:hypothetical protein
MMEPERIPADEDTPPSPVDQIGALIGEVRSLAEAEIDYAKARLSYSGGVVRKAGLFALFAILAISGAAIALILGLLLALAAYIGPIIATLIIVAAFALAAYVFAIFARKTARNLKFDEGSDE